MRHFLLIAALALLASFTAVSCGFFDDGSTSKETPPPPPPTGASKYVKPAPPMTAPVRMTVSPDGDVLVTDHGTGGVYILNGTSMVGAKSFLAAGRRPLGIAAGEEGIYIGNLECGCIDLYSYEGQLIKRLLPNGTFGKPVDIELDDRYWLMFVLDTEAKKVFVYERDGRFMYSFPASGLDTPTAMTIDRPTRTIYVSDYGILTDSNPDGSIKAYDYGGNAKLPILSGTAVNESGYEFSRPQGLAVTSDGYLFMVDAILGNVTVYDPNTQAGVKVLGSLGSGDGQLFAPMDVAVDSATNDVIVADYSNGRLTVFNSGGTVP